MSAVLAAAAAGDISSFYDRCDERGQKNLFQTAIALFTMDVANRRRLDGGSVNAIKEAFEDELGVEADSLASAESDPQLRRKCLLLLIEKSPGVVASMLKESLGGFSKMTPKSYAPKDEKNIIVTFEGPGYPKLRLTRQEGRWVVAGGLSYPGEM